MKVRKLAVALALAGGLGSGVAQALGLGEIELQSYLNQPLDAEIDLRRTDGINPDDISVNLASERDYQRVGLTRDYFLTRLQFDVTTSPRGELVITVSSREPVREPYLNFLVEVIWPSGRVMREYAVLIDPPVFADEVAPREQAQAPATRAPERTQQPTQQPARSPAARAPARQAGGTYSTGASDTLWSIAQSVRPDSSLTVQQVMLSLQDLNPDAFIDGNINRLRSGQVLRIPDADQVRQRTQAEAVREVAAQNRAFADRATAVDTADRAAAVDRAATTQAADSPELRLVADPEQQDRRADGSAGGDGRQDGRADAGRAVALEELDRVRRENDELTSRMEDLQDQVETLQRLIELKDNQLSEMQRSAGQEPADMASAEEADAISDDMAEAEDGLAPLPGADDPATGPGDRGPDGSPDDAFMPSEDRDVVAMDDRAAPADQVVEDPVAATGQPQETQPQPVAPVPPEPSFMARMIDMIAGNPIYQVALGGFLVLLLLLGLLVSRRRAAAKENEFYRQLEEDEADSGGFDLNLGEEEGAGGEPLEEADRYVSYGQHDAAAEVLETAISREPSRSDLRLKLLAVYAASGNRPSFDKQYAELEAMEMDEVMPEAHSLRDRLEDVESTPSIDELESQLRSDNYGSRNQEPERSTEQLSDEFEGTFGADTGENISEDDPDDLISSFEELELPEDDRLSLDDEISEGQSERPIDYDLSEIDHAADEPSTADDKRAASADTDDFGIDFDLEDASADSVAEDELGADFGELDDLAPKADSPVEEDEFGSLDLDDLDEPAVAEESDLPDLDAEMAGLEQSLEGDDTDLDESFLDELDAELDKAASGDEGDLNELELDVSDEDLALMDDVSEPADADKDDLSLDDLELDEPFAEGELDLDNDSAVASSEDDFSDLDVPELDENVEDRQSAFGKAGSAASGAAASGIDDIDEADLSDDEDFDFLAGTDEVATKLDLARAYVEMGDAEGAREILEEVILEGTDEQKTDAQSLLKKLP